MNHNEREYEFTLLLDGISTIDTQEEDAFFEAGCDDATISVRCGRVYLIFCRDAMTLKDAVISAIGDVKKANIGAAVLRVDQSDLVTQAEIARRIGRSRQLVHQYITGQRGSGGFPAPAGDIGDDAPVYYWREVAKWLSDNNLIEESEYQNARELAVINGVLELAHQKLMDPDLTKEIELALSPMISS